MNIFVSCLLLCYSILACANHDFVVQVSSTANCFTISLPANPTTGYQWSVLEMDNHLIKLIQNHYQRPLNNRVGSRGQMIFIFKIKRKSKRVSTYISFKYARPWDSVKAAEYRRVSVHFLR